MFPKALCANASRICLAAAAVAAGLSAPVSAVELLISNRAANQVLRIDAATGALIDTGEGAGPGVFIGATVPGGHGGLSMPANGGADILLGSDGNVYVVSAGTNSIKKYDGENGHYLGDFVTSGSGGLNLPWGMTWGPDGNLYVVSSGTNEVLRYQGLHGSSPGAFMDVFVTAGSGGLSAPRGIMFGNDQYRGILPPGTAQDGYPDLYVASFGNNPGRVLRYNGVNGQFVDVYAELPGGQNPNNMIYEQFYTRNSANYNTLNRGNLLVSFESGTLGIYSGTFSKDDYGPNIGGSNYFGPFHTGDTTRGTLVWGPRRPSSNDSQQRQSLYLPGYFTGTIYNVGANEQDLGTLVDLNASFPGVRPVSLLLKCGRNPATLIRKVLNNNAMRGTLHTLRLQGDNLSAITAVNLRRMRNNGGGNMDAVDGPTIAGGNLRMDGDDLLVDFDLSSARGGRYAVVPTDSCGNAMRFPDAVLVYMPTLANAGFETGSTNNDYDGESANLVCTDPGKYGNKPPPRHWDIMKGGQFGLGTPESQFEIKRDGNVWFPCGGGVTTIANLGDLHYGSIQTNNNTDDWIGMYQSIAAPNIDETGTSTAPYTIYVDAAMVSWEGLSSGRIRLYDGDNYAGTVITETIIPSTNGTPGLVRSPAFSATVPQGYVYQSDPPILTIAFILQSVPGDVNPSFGAQKALHIDNVRTVLAPCEHSPWADADDDGDVDIDDFGAFQRCYSGQAAAPGDATCTCFDRDQDGRVNDVDLVEFTNCAQGANVPVVAPECQ